MLAALIHFNRIIGLPNLRGLVSYILMKFQTNTVDAT